MKTTSAKATDAAADPWDISALTIITTFLAKKKLFRHKLVCAAYYYNEIDRPPEIQLTSLTKAQHITKKF